MLKEYNLFFLISLKHLNIIVRTTFIILVFTTNLHSANQPKIADFVFKNGIIYTMEDKQQKAQAIVVIGKKIAYVGSDNGAITFIGKKTRVINLGGKMVLPGFIDSHIHPTLSFLVNGADLQTDSIFELIKRLEEWSNNNPKAKFIQGFGWRNTIFPPSGPTKAILDKHFPDKPVILFSIDAQSAWINSKTLEIAAIDAKSQDHAEGANYFQRDAAGGPTGWVVGTLAQQQLLSSLNPITPESVMKITEGYLIKFASAGITAIFDAGIATIPTEYGIENYIKMEYANNLPVRIATSYYWNNSNIKDPVSIVKNLNKSFNSELVKIKTLKIILDGCDAQHTAVMLQGYADEKNLIGKYVIDLKEIDKAIVQAQESEINTQAHCYGNAATRAYLDAVEKAQKAYPRSPSRHTAAHCIFVSDQDIPRFMKLNVTMQSSAQWATPDPTIKRTTEIVGEQLAFKEFFRHNSVLKAGGRLAFGSDWPTAGYVSTFRPLDAIQVAVTRAMLPQYGHDQFAASLPPETERISLDQALKAATLNAAYVLGLEKQVGSLKPGKLADLVILEKDLYAIPPTEISTTRVKLTMMNGKITYEDQ